MTSLSTEEVHLMSKYDFTALSCIQKGRSNLPSFFQYDELIGRDVETMYEQMLHTS